MANGTPRTRLDPDARRAQLISLGVEHIKARPFDQVLVDDVIRTAGISKGLLFHYFATKRDFQVAVIRAAAGELLFALEPDPAVPVAKQLRAGLEAYIAYITQQPASYIAIVRGAGSDEALLAVFEETRAAIVDLVAAGIGGVDHPLLRLAIRGWIAMVEESTFHWLEHQPCSREALIDLLEQTALQAMPIALQLATAVPADMRGT